MRALLSLLLVFQQPEPIVLAQATMSNQANDRGPAFYMVRTPGGKREDAYGAVALRRRLSLNLQDVPIADALTAITAQTGIRFVYVREEVPVDRHVSLSAQDIALAAALTEILFDAGVDVELLNGDQVALVKRRASSAQHERRRLTGHVLDAETKAPLSGAVVTVTGTTIGTLTSDSGTFAIIVPDNATGLTIRRIGYHQASVTLTADQTTVDVELTKDPLKLETQVVTGVATTISSRNAANAVAVVNSDQITEVPAPTLENALQSKIPGAIIEQNNGGAPGGGLQIQIRGITSIEADASPLYVIDGIIVNNETTNSGLNAITQAALGTPGYTNTSQFFQDNSPNRLADINPNDIESIEVLKGSSASAIYGAKAASGVVIINTKKGSPGKTQWDVTQRFGTFTLANKLPLRTFPTLGSAQGWYLNDVKPGDIGTSAATADSAFIKSVYGGPQDFQDQLFGGGELSYETDLSARGASENGKTTYFLSALSKYDNGILINTGYNKQSVRTNISQTFLTNITVSANLFYANSDTRRGVTGNDNTGISPYDVLSYTPQFINLNNRSATGAWANNVFGPANPFADAQEIQTPETVHRFIGGGTVNWTLFHTTSQSLQVSGIGGADYTDERAQLYAPPDLQIEQSLPSALPGVATTNEANTEYLNWSVNVIHHYTLPVVDATTSIGLADERRSFYNPNIVGENLVPGQNSFTAGSVQTGYYTQSALRDFSFYGQEQLLLLDQRLALTGGVTAERSSNNGDDEKYYTYPKLSASFRIPHFASFLDELKLRTAYGQSGTEPNYGVRYSGLIQQVVGGTSGTYTTATLGDPSVQPETNTEIEGGFDATLFSSRAQFSATLYQKRISNVLLEAAVNPSFGATNQWLNGGQFTNRGIELSLAMTPIQMRNGLTWVSTTTYYRNYSVVDNLSVPSFDLPGSGGGPFGIFYITPGRSVSEVVNAGELQPNGAPVQVGDAQPAFQMGFTNDFTFAHFHLHSVLDWKYGGTAQNANNLYFDNGLFLLDSAASAKRLVERANGLTPYVEDAGYIKLREVTLAYDLPGSVIRAVGRGYLSTARLSLSGRNLLAWFKYTGPDPEVSGDGNVDVTRGNDVTQYPPARSYFVSLELGF